MYIKISDADLRLLMFATFRYSLGRRTYIPSFITDLIIENYELFNEHDWIKFIDEINDEKCLGDPCDIQTWNKFYDFCKERLRVKKSE